MSFIDFSATVILLLCAVNGWRRGFFEIALDTTGVLLSLALSLLLCTYVVDVLNSLQLKPGFTFALSFLLVFFSARMLLRFLAEQVHSALPEDASKSGANKALGVLPALAKGMVAYSLVLALVASAPLRGSGQVVTDSCLGPTMLGIGSALRQAAAPIFSGVIEECAASLSPTNWTATAPRVNAPVQCASINLVNDAALSEVTAKARASKGSMITTQSTILNASRFALQ